MKHIIMLKLKETNINFCHALRDGTPVEFDSEKEANKFGKNYCSLPFDVIEKHES